MPPPQLHKSSEDVQAMNEVSSIDFSGINAGPAVRKITRELEIDLKKINGSAKCHDHKRRSKKLYSLINR